MHLQRTLTTNPFQKRTDLEDSTGARDREWAQNKNMRTEHHNHNKVRCSDSNKTKSVLVVVSQSLLAEH